MNTAAQGRSNSTSCSLGRSFGVQQFSFCTKWVLGLRGKGRGGGREGQWGSNYALMRCIHQESACACTPAAEHTIITVGRGTAGATPLGAVEVVAASKQLDQVHAHIAV